MRRWASESGSFDFGDVVAAITEKLIRRHPHVFGPSARREARRGQRRLGAHQARGEGAQECRARRARPRRRASSTASLSPCPPSPEPRSCNRAPRASASIGRRRSRSSPNCAKSLPNAKQPSMPADEAAVMDEIGDLLFTVANLARRLGVDPEAAARGANAKFERRFRAMEAERRGVGARHESDEPRRARGALGRSEGRASDRSLLGRRHSRALMDERGMA